MFFFFFFIIVNAESYTWTLDVLSGDTDKQIKWLIFMHLSNNAEPPTLPTLVPNSNFLFHGSFSIDQTGLMAHKNRSAIRLPVGGRHHVDATEQIAIPGLNGLHNCSGTPFSMIPIKTIIMFRVSGWNNHSEPN